MKKIKILGLLVLSLLLITQSTVFATIIPNKTINADVGTKRIPSGTVIKLKLIDPIGTKNMGLGDQFDLMTIEDIRVDKSIIIPTGSVIRGSIQKISPRRMLSKGAIMYLDFDHVVGPTGKQVPLKVGICVSPHLTYDGGLGSRTNYGTATVLNAKNTAKIVKVSTNWGWQTGEQILNGSPKYVLAPISAVLSTPVAGIYFIGDAVVNIFKKGDDIELNQGDTLNIMLLKPLDMPIY